ncbi:MAG: formyltetrahydrofolate deformylase [Anaerolineae bacterium]|nr:formyltetrahydrofolate deformylase [Thermoflexales bacterium]MDW8408662.1 formyltetrahydrofolate deformylase [Anaerolineae bacterium]
MPTTTQTESAILLIHCPDRTGLVAAVTDWLFKHDGNILYLDQHVDQQEGIFFMRVEWDLARFNIPREKIGEFFQISIADRYAMRWGLHFSDEKPRMAIFVSKLGHCLYDILSHTESGEWPVQVPLIISNHPHLEPVARRAGIDYHLLPVTPETKSEAERRQLDLLEQYQIDLVVLARYMQILSAQFIARYPNRIINIHHSFLPAFAGANPYRAAHERGVKIIGATAHYVTPELDAGPIIEQDVTRVSHKDSVADMVRKGQDLEKLVLSRAIWYHLKRKVLVYGNRTVVFG